MIMINRNKNHKQIPLFIHLFLQIIIRNKSLKIAIMIVVNSSNNNKSKIHGQPNGISMAKNNRWKQILKYLLPKLVLTNHLINY